LKYQEVKRGSPDSSCHKTTTKKLEEVSLEMPPEKTHDRCFLAMVSLCGTLFAGAVNMF
jgi:hypothetical protein